MTGEEVKIPYMRGYRVFNADQIDGLPEEFYRPAVEARDLGIEGDPELDAFFAATGAQIETTAKPEAYYHPARDTIHRPPVNTFHGVGGYYATLAHETIHWTGHQSRLDRLTKARDREAYAREELVAEIGACMTCIILGLSPDFGQSGAYIEGWLKALRDDKKFIFTAASVAQKAVDFLTTNQIQQRAAA